jgi:hypothetical protein
VPQDARADEEEQRREKDDARHDGIDWQTEIVERVDWQWSEQHEDRYR